MSEDQNEQNAQQEPAPVDPAKRQAMDRLNDSNRVLLESRMIDRSKRLTPEQIETIREAFIAYCDTRSIQSATVARQIGYSNAVVSSFGGKKYKGNVVKVAHAINDWMERDARRTQAVRPKDYIETWIAEDIRGQIGLADRLGMMLVIVVPSGAGKTYVLRERAETMRGLYIYIHDNMRPRDLLRALGTGLGRKNESGTAAQLHTWITAALKGTRRVVFLDEAQRLGKSLGYVRSIYDEAGVPIVMAGTSDIIDAIDDRTEGRGQFSSRLIRYNALDHARNAEGPDGGTQGRDLFSIEEVKRFFDMKGIRLDRDGLRMMWLLACLPGYGCLRLIEHVADTAFVLYDGIELLKRDHVVNALKLLQGSLATYMERLTERHDELTRPAKVA